MSPTPLTDATDRRNKRISRSTGLRIGLELFAIFAYRKFALPLLIPCSDERTQRPSYCSSLQTRIRSVLGTDGTNIFLSQPGLSLMAVWQLLRYGREFVDALPYVFFSEEEIEVITETRRKRRQIDKVHEDVQSHDEEEGDSRDGDDGSEDSGADGDGEEDEDDESDDSTDQEKFMDRVLKRGNTMLIPGEPNIRKIGCILQDINTGALSVRSYIPHAISTPQILLSSDEHDDLAYQDEELAMSRHGCEDVWDHTHTKGEDGERYDFGCDTAQHACLHRSCRDCQSHQCSDGRIETRVYVYDSCGKPGHQPGCKCQRQSNTEPAGLPLDNWALSFPTLRETTRPEDVSRRNEDSSADDAKTPNQLENHERCFDEESRVRLPSSYNRISALSLSEPKCNICLGAVDAELAFNEAGMCHLCVETLQASNFFRNRTSKDKSSRPRLAGMMASGFQQNSDTVGLENCQRLECPSKALDKLRVDNRIDGRQRDVHFDPPSLMRHQTLDNGGPFNTSLRNVTAPRRQQRENDSYRDDTSDNTDSDSEGSNADQGRSEMDSQYLRTRAMAEAEESKYAKASLRMMNEGPFPIYKSCSDPSHGPACLCYRTRSFGSPTDLTQGDQASNLQRDQTATPGNALLLQPSQEIDTTVYDVSGNIFQGPRHLLRAAPSDPAAALRWCEERVSWGLHLPRHTDGSINVNLPGCTEPNFQDSIRGWEAMKLYGWQASTSRGDMVSNGIPLPKAPTNHGNDVEIAQLSRAPGFLPGIPSFRDDAGNVVHSRPQASSTPGLVDPFNDPVDNLHSPANDFFDPVQESTYGDFSTHLVPNVHSPTHVKPEGFRIEPNATHALSITYSPTTDIEPVSPSLDSLEVTFPSDSSEESDVFAYRSSNDASSRNAPSTPSHKTPSVEQDNPAYESFSPAIHGAQSPSSAELNGSETQYTRSNSPPNELTSPHSRHSLYTESDPIPPDSPSSELESPPDPSEEPKDLPSSSVKDASSINATPSSAHGIPGVEQNNTADDKSSIPATRGAPSPLTKESEGSMIKHTASDNLADQPTSPHTPNVESTPSPSISSSLEFVNPADLSDSEGSPARARSSEEEDGFTMVD
ncbi:MAG: hypothetical protein Q9183_003532 [Haloplaca sp. 2 TL-2023]